jgi:hypothetical protein
VVLSNAEMQAAHRKHAHWYAVGYELKPGPDPAGRDAVAAWCEGVWESHARAQARIAAGKLAT